MKDILKGIKPIEVMKYFEKLTRIPRESGNEKAVSDFLVDFAKENKLDVIQEPCLNVIIKKPASKGYEDHKKVILQGHIDMVCVKEDDYDFDFEKDPIPLLIDGDFIKTKGTTLGGDNGIAVAMMMAVLEDASLKHPEISALFTVSEETGMDGVLDLNPENVYGDILINLDSEEEGVLLASCAGGVNSIIELDIEKKESKNDTAYRLIVHGLKGGHSGVEIQNRRANAAVILGRVIHMLNSTLSFDMSNINGGDKPNAIPKNAQAIIVFDKSDTDKFNDEINAFEFELKSEYEVSDPEIMVTFEEIDKPDFVYEDKTKESIINILSLIPNAVQTMSAGIEGLVESSSNLGVLEEKDDKIVFVNSVRSSVASLKKDITDKIQIISDLTGAEMTSESDYPSWPFKVESEIRELMKKEYLKMYHTELKVDAIHAGLECGFLKEKIGDIDMVSLGPDLFDVHTPKERLSISSTQRIYEFLLKIL
ncbi:MAG: aminoacyl-histidine dipeptidase, partial [Bacillota bacterium]|nr:aminoacyl-histidine dipeptidase [Bacillota bacterium]